MNNEYIHHLRKKVKKAFDKDKKRYWHTIGVANTSACLAMRYQVSMERAYIAGLLHDCAKCLSDEQLLSQCKQYGIEISESEQRSPYLLHAKLGAYLAQHKYGISDDEICNAIRFHTTGCPGMTRLEEIVFIADYMEPFRNRADNLEAIRTLAFEDISKAIYQVTQSTINYLSDRHKAIDPATVKTYEFYKQLYENADTAVFL